VIEMDFGQIATIAVMIHGAVTLVRNLNREKMGALPPWVWNALAFVLGIGYAVIWSYNAFVGVEGLPPHLSGLASAGSVPGQVLTGILLGSAAGGWHELFDFLSGMAKGAKARVFTGTQA
jgi:hypothetical protein